MTEQTIISDAAAAAATLDAKLAGIGTDQFLCCNFLPEISKWSAITYSNPGHEPTGYGIGESLASAIADLHPPQWMKHARPADPGEWTTDEARP